MMQKNQKIALTANRVSRGRASERRTRDPAQRGSGSAGDAATAFHGAGIPLRGHTFLRKALFRPTRLHHLEVFFIDLVFLRFLHII